MQLVFALLAALPVAQPAVPGRKFLVDLPDGGEATVDLTGARGKLAVEWTHPITGKSTPGDAMAGGAKRTRKAPIDGDAVFCLRTML